MAIADRCVRMRSTPAGELRPGEEAVELPKRASVAVYFIGLVRTPWRTRQECPKQGDPSGGPVCTIEIAERWRKGLAGITRHKRLQVLYWMHEARRDLVFQTPFQRETTGTFALRSPARPNPIAVSIVELLGVSGGILQVRGLDCLDGTPLIDLKPEHGDIA